LVEGELTELFSVSRTVVREAMCNLQAQGLEGTYGRVDNGLGVLGITMDLGYHTVVGIDTCIFVSTGEPFTQGSRSITWNGKDKVGNDLTVVMCYEIISKFSAE